jgi:hypothetical protein
MNKMIFYSLLLVINIAAFILIGISFLSGPSSGEGAIKMSEMEAFLNLSIYIIIVSIVFSALAALLGYLFRRSINANMNTIKKIFIGEFILFLFVFLIAYGYVYLIA